MTFLVIRARSDRGVNVRIKDTMSMLNLTKVNHATLIPDSPSYRGMLQKVKDYVTWGEVDASTVSSLIRQRGRLIGEKPITDEVVKSGSSFKSIDEISEAIASGEATLKEIEGMKPVFRLHPPRGSKGWGGIKRSYSVGGALGFRGEDIATLAERMF